MGPCESEQREQIRHPSMECDSKLSEVLECFTRVKTTRIVDKEAAGDRTGTHRSGPYISYLVSDILPRAIYSSAECIPDGVLATVRAS